MYRTLAVSGYRSLRDVSVRLGRVTVVTGANGSGKSSLYKALRLLAGCALGDAVASLAREGGLSSVLWAGPESLQGARRTGTVQGTVRNGPVSLRLGIGADALSYLIDLGLPQQGLSAFDRDPEIKREVVWGGPLMRASTLAARRKRGLVEVRDEGPWEELPFQLAPHQSMLLDLPELRALRDDLAAWRFYDTLRTDAGAPARQPRVGTRTWALAGDGADLAAALQTIHERGREPIGQFIEDAFPGSSLEVPVTDGIFELALHQPGMLRPLRAAELSDGTLRYLMWLAALLAPARPPLMALNEPENSLHPSLIAPLGRLIARSARETQIVVVTHSQALVEALTSAVTEEDLELVDLVKDTGETVIADQGLLSRPSWEWGRR
ncbi:AAA family ATPase [Tessaracoccus sp. ZS01]|uniref:AAA family ATPase n=1 Tax=Tessaracoccus sp. ZS01 TaxID=1906324 RepID=UPI00096F24D5|nr:AAA family ATPase [Tessaracoccus sp. ZS01]MCG6566091.1 ATP-binding protein [Tessaracoccus sp. ZS01]OMG58595.1 ATP-binding protein [Tessaracoccus sp. ZS01]